MPLDITLADALLILASTHFALALVCYAYGKEVGNEKGRSDLTHEIEQKALNGPTNRQTIRVSKTRSPFFRNE